MRSRATAADGEADDVAHVELQRIGGRQVFGDENAWFAQDDRAAFEAEQHGDHVFTGVLQIERARSKQRVGQLALLVDSRYNNGLSRNLSGVSGERAAINHGFKAVQIGVSAWTAEALKQTMPASVFSRSTECHNQDKVSMGTIAARDCLRVIELTEQVVAAMLIAARQGLALRERVGLNAQLDDTLAAMYADLGQRIALVEEDRALDGELRQLLLDIRAQCWELYANE